MKVMYESEKSEKLFGFLEKGLGEDFPVYLRDERRDEFKSKYLEQGTK
jgi:hypothetical protein